MSQKELGRKMRLAGAVIATLLVLFALLLYQRDAPLALRNLARSPIAPGVEVVKADLSRGGRFFAIYADPRKVRTSILLNESSAPLASLAEEALLVVNGGYFTPKRKPTGLLVSHGRILSPLVKRGGGAGTGVLVADRTGAVHLFERERVERAQYEGAEIAIQAGPRLIEPGGRDGIHSDDGARANRTVLGKDRRGRLVVAVTYDGTDGKRTGPTLFELQRLLGRRGVGALSHELALDFGLNLDGGQSTGLVLRDAAHAVELPEATAVYSVLSIEIPR